MKGKINLANLRKRVQQNAFTLIELLVVMSIIAILVSLLTVVVLRAQVRGQMMQTLNNARQIQLATQMMMLDYQTSGQNDIDWTFKNGKPMSVQEFSKALIESQVLSAQELQKLYTAPGKGPNNANPNEFKASNIAFKIFPVRDSSPGDHPFLVTANWVSRSSLGPSRGNPYGKKGFIMIRKNGEAAIYNRLSDALNAFPEPSTHSADIDYRYTPLN